MSLGPVTGAPSFSVIGPGWQPAVGEITAALTRLQQLRQLLICTHEQTIRSICGEGWHGKRPPNTGTNGRCTETLTNGTTGAGCDPPTPLSVKNTRRRGVGGLEGGGLGGRQQGCPGGGGAGLGLASGGGWGALGWAPTNNSMTPGVKLWTTVGFLWGWTMLLCQQAPASRGGTSRRQRSSITTTISADTTPVRSVRTLTLVPAAHRTWCGSPACCAARGSRGWHK